MSDAVASRPLALPVLPKLLLEPRRPFIAIPIAVGMSIGGALALATFWSLIFPTAPPPDFGGVSGFAALFALVIFAPVSETLIMAAVLAVLLRFLPPIIAILTSAALWGLAHSLLAPTWGLVIWWPFLIFSTLYVVWRQRSLFAGLAVPATVHALQNLPPALVVATGNI